VTANQTIVDRFIIQITLSKEVITPAQYRIEGAIVPTKEAAEIVWRIRLMSASFHDTAPGRIFV